MRKVVGGFLAIIIILAGIFWVSKMYFFGIGYTQPLMRNDQGISYTAKAVGKDFYVLDSQGAWKKTFLAGVDIGLGAPGTFPGEFAIGYEQYFDWFTQIGEMGSNVVRVYTPQAPAFYRALYEYNRVAATPLYLMQGVYMDESDVLQYGDVFAEGSVTIGDMRQDIVDCVNMMHGNAVVSAKPGKASGVYRYDVSQYVIGWILGIECEAYLVEGTNKAHPEMTEYRGRYIVTENASPFEVFIAQMMDLAVTYESDTYQMQRPVAFSNWVTTDPLTHPNEPRPAEDSAVIDVEHIRGAAGFTPGFFASYHVYPYYPDFLNYPSGDPAVDENTYYAYVRSLVEYHSMPVLISEFGLPTSRGVTHINHLSGLNQGGNNEREQGEALIQMLLDIHRSGCMGGIVFAWHDEWFKTSWNTMDFDDNEARPKWQNVESSEENFGLIAFSAFPSIQIDGEDADWKAADAVGPLKVDWDEKYLYLHVAADDFENQVHYVPIDTIGGEGSALYENARFDRNADFVLVIDGTDDTRLLIDPYYDPNYKLYGTVLFSPEELAEYAVTGGGAFKIVRQVISNEMLMPATGQVVPIQFWDTGSLRYGISNPDDPAYDSLADFCAGDGFVELRIPWMCLNFADPSSGKILSNLHTGGPFSFETIGNIYLGVGKPGETEPVAMSAFRLPAWGYFQYAQREKLSYSMLQEAFPRYATYPIGTGEEMLEALKARDTRLLYVRIDRQLRNTDVIVFFLIVLVMLVGYLYILLLAVNYHLNRVFGRQERERLYLRSLLRLPEEQLQKKLHRRYLCSNKGVELLCRFIIEEKPTDEDTKLLSILRCGKYRAWMRKMLISGDMMLRILVIRLVGLLRISRFQQQILSLMLENRNNLNLQYTGLMAFSMIGNLDSIVNMCGEGLTKQLSYRSLKEICANYGGNDKNLLYEVLLESPDLYIRRIIVKNIGDEGFTNLSEYLLRMLDTPDVNLLCDIIRSLGQLRCKKAGKRIAGYARSDNWTLRNVAVVALANINARAYMPALLDGLRDREWWVRYNSANELCRHIPVDELAALAPTLDDRFAREILQFAIQETRMMEQEASPA